MWDKVISEVRGLRDALGMTVDEPVVEAVAALRMLGLNTTMSCGGHLDRITGGPYIMFCSLQAYDIEQKYRALTRKDKRYHSLRAEARKLNLQERAKLTPYLNEFYKDRQVPYGNRLIITPVGAEGSRLKCQSADDGHILPTSSYKLILNAHRAELQAFTDFLKSQLI